MAHGAKYGVFVAVVRERGVRTAGFTRGVFFGDESRAHANAVRSDRQHITLHGCVVGLWEAQLRLPNWIPYDRACTTRRTTALVEAMYRMIQDADFYLSVDASALHAYTQRSFAARGAGVERLFPCSLFFCFFRERDTKETFVLSVLNCSRLKLVTGQKKLALFPGLSPLPEQPIGSHPSVVGLDFSTSKGLKGT